MRVKCNLSGLKEIEDSFNKKISNMNYTDKALNDIGLDLIGKAKDLAPVDTGDLKGSGYTKLGKNIITVGFNAKYALVQHEGIGFSHPRGGQAKYLEEPFKRNITKYINHLKNSTVKAVE